MKHSDETRDRTRLLSLIKALLLHLDSHQSWHWLRSHCATTQRRQVSRCFASVSLNVELRPWTKSKCCPAASCFHPEYVLEAGPLQPPPARVTVQGHHAITLIHTEWQHQRHAPPPPPPLPLPLLLGKQCQTNAD